MGNERQRKLGFVMSYAGIFVSSIIGIAFTPYMILKLGKIEYGLYQVLYAAIGYVAMLDFGLGSTLTRYILKYRSSNEQDKVDSVVSISVKIYCAIGLFVMLIISILTANLDVIFSETINGENLRYAQKMFMVMGATTAISLVSHAMSGIQTASEKHAVVKGVYILRHVLRVALISVLLQMDIGAMSVVMADFAVTFALLLFDVLYCKIGLKTAIFRGKWNNQLAKSLLSFSFYAFLQIMITQTNNGLDRVLLGRMSTLEVAALYGVVMQLHSLFISTGGVISGITMPRITNVVFSNATREELTDCCVQYSRYQFHISAPLIGGFAVLGQAFASLWVPEYDSRAVWICVLLIVSPQILESVEGTIFNVMKAKNMQKMRSLLLLGVMVVHIGMAIALISVNDIYGPALATCISFIIGNTILSNIYYHKKVGINMVRYFKGIFKGILPTLIISIAIGVFINYIPVGGWLGFMVKGFLYVLVYGVLTLLIGLNKTEKALLVRLRKKLLKR